MHFVQYLSVTHFTRNVVITFSMYARLIRCVTDDKDDLRTRNVIECSFVCNYISHTAMRKLQYRTYRAVSDYRMTYRVLQMTREAIARVNPTASHFAPHPSTIDQQCCIIA